jgi:ABC-type glycerol-3-phosphate transport system permease component
MKSKKRAAILAAIGAIIFLLTVWSVFPLIYLWIISFASLGSLPHRLELPKHMTLDNWREILYGTGSIWPYMLNSFIVGGITVAISLAVILPAAYSFSRYRTKVNNTIFTSLLFFRMTPWICLVIPIFFMMKEYDLLGTRLGLSLSHLVYTVPLGVWLMKGYFDMLSPEIEEAALVDGANRFQVFWRISTPLSAPGIAVTGMFVFLLSYIEYLFALILTRKPTFTLPVRLGAYMAIHETYWRLIACTTIVSLIPTIGLFIFLQRHLARGFTMGAVK